MCIYNLHDCHFHAWEILQGCGLSVFTVYIVCDWVSLRGGKGFVLARLP